MINTAKYGLKTRQQFVKYSEAGKAYYFCKFCLFKKVKRVAIGIWKCRKCKVKIAGGAFIPTEWGLP